MLWSRSCGKNKPTRWSAQTKTQKTNGETMRKDYMLKRNGRPVGADVAESNGADNAPFEYRENDRINAQIDSYIKQNPKHWDAIKAMPRERLERHAVWQQIRF